jgi:protein gp37
MYREQNQYGQDPNNIRRTKPATFDKPWVWNKKDPGLIFTSSWTDFFLEEADPWRLSAWEIISKTPNNTYQILTKRPENILDRLPYDWGDGYPNVWLGVSVENQEMADLRIPILVDIPARLRFLSCEPLIGPVDINPFIFTRKNPHMVFSKNEIHWIIVGGESGPAGSTRPMNPVWASDIQFLCKVAGIPFFFKQWGTWGRTPLNNTKYIERVLLKDGTFYPAGEELSPHVMGMYHMSPLGKKLAGCTLAGEEYHEMPEG